MRWFKSSLCHSHARDFPGVCLMDPLLLALLDLTDQRALLARGERLLVGCSGGLDSLCLVHALKALASLRGWHLSACYVHHGLRDVAEREARTLAEGMADWGVPFRVRRVTIAPQGSPEERAREARYDALNGAARELACTALVLGHHADDQAETVLYRLAKGSALPGLLGIPMVRPQPGGPRIVRPWLETPKAELEAYARRHGLTWFEDLTNQDTAIPRNRIRSRILPELKALNPALHRTLGANLAVLADEDDYLRLQAEHALALLIRLTGPGLLGWEAAPTRSLHPALQRRLLALAYARVMGGPRGMTQAKLERVRTILAEPGGPLELGDGLRALHQYGQLFLYREVLPPDPIPAHPDGQRVAAHGVRLEAADPANPQAPSALEAWFDADRLPEGLVWRLARPERDRFTPWGRSTPHPLGTFLTKSRVPKPLRTRLTVLAAGDDVLWIPGLRRGAQAPISQASSRAVRGVMDSQAWFDNV